MNSCLICWQHTTHKVKYESKHLPIPQRPFDGICLDCVGPLARSSRGFKWILTRIDLHSSFLLAVPMKSKSADDVIHTHIESILPRIGPSRYILMNNRMEFKNDTMREVLHRLNTEHKFTTVYFPKGNPRLENSHALLKRCMSKYMDMLNEQWDKCLKLATYAFNILPSCDHSSSPYFLVFGKEPLDAQLRELEDLHRYSGSNCGLKHLQQLKEVWRAHTNNLRNIRLHRARKRDKYAKELPIYSVGTQVLVRNFTRKPLERKFLSGFSTVKVLLNNLYELLKPNGQTFRVNVHHIRPNSTGRKVRQLVAIDPHNRVLQNRENLSAPIRLT